MMVMVSGSLSRSRRRISSCAGLVEGSNRGVAIWMAWTDGRAPALEVSREGENREFQDSSGLIWGCWSESDGVE
jgi:hypothetical protein